MPGDPVNPSPSRRILYLRSRVVLFFILLHSAVISAQYPETRNTGIPQCYSAICGDVNITYPLYVSEGPNTDFCGYRGLGVACRDGQPVLNLGNDSYRVAAVEYEASTITLQDMDLLGSDCPRARHNLTLEAGVPLNYSEADAYLLFFFNCSGIPLDVEDLLCLRGSDGRRSYVFPLGTVLPPYNWWGGCWDFVIAPVLLESMATNLSSSFNNTVKQGFHLRWQQPDMADCVSCERTKGRCGLVYNKDAPGYDPVCFCSNGAFSPDCSGNPYHAYGSSAGAGDNRKKRKIIIGVCSGVGGFFLASFLAFLLYRRKKLKARSGSSTLLFRAASSEPSSKQDPEIGSTHYPTHVFQYEELREATDGFSTSNELGDGGFGVVYKGKLRDGRVVAVKRLYESNYKRVEQFLNEMAILSCLRHQNLVTLYGCTDRRSRELLLVYEFVPNGTVADHLHGHRTSEGGLTWPVRLSIAVETATALAYLHAVEPQIIHRDVKSNNILLDNNFRVKVADFGLSRLFPLDVTHVSTAPQGTPGYVDPEYHQCYQLTDKSDVYSFGVVLVELISSLPAVDITRHRHEINLANMAINKIQGGALHELVDPALGFETDREVKRMVGLVAELAFMCLQGEKEMRPSMAEVVDVLQGIQDGGGDAADPPRDMRPSMGDVADVLQGIQGGGRDPAHRPREEDHGTAPADELSLLKTNVPPSPDSVMDKWTSRTTTPNASG